MSVKVPVLNPSRRYWLVMMLLCLYFLRWSAKITVQGYKTLNNKTKQKHWYQIGKPVEVKQRWQTCMKWPKCLISIFRSSRNWNSEQRSREKRKQSVGLQKRRSYKRREQRKSPNNGSHKLYGLCILGFRKSFFFN